ncbi:MAG: NUDIX hydrolase [Alphaproteobacteria bacterium]
MKQPDEDLPRSAPRPPRKPGSVGVKPRDAAALILVKRDGPEPAVLMGHRHHKHVFMPNTFVFPGGRVDMEDAKVPVAAPLRTPVADRLARNATRRRAQALALAAVREAFEETGLMIGRPTPTPVDPAGLADSWRPFFEAGLAPALDLLDYVFRAITPPGDVRRFNARFFICDAAHAHGTLGGSGELVDLTWLPIGEALTTPNTPGVTKLVLREVRRLLAESDPWNLPTGHPVPRYHALYGRERIAYD